MKSNVSKAMILFAICATALVGCGNSSSKVNNTYNSNEIAVLEDEQPATKEYVALDEIKTTGLYDNKVQIGDEIFEFPIELNTLLDMGVETNENVDYLLDAGSNNKKDIQLSFNGYDFTVTVVNTDTTDKKAKDCKIYNLTCSGNNAISYDTEGNEVNSNPLFFGKGLSTLSSLDEVKEIWGDCSYTINQTDNITLCYQDEPYYTMQDSSCDPYTTYSSTGREYRITFDRNNVDVVKEIKLSFEEDINQLQSEDKTLATTDSNISIKLSYPPKIALGNGRSNLTTETDFQLKIDTYFDGMMGIFRTSNNETNEYSKDVEIIEDNERYTVYSNRNTSEPYSTGGELVNNIGISIFDKKTSIRFGVNGSLIRPESSKYTITDEYLDLLEQQLLNIAKTYEIIEK